MHILLATLGFVFLALVSLLHPSDGHMSFLAIALVLAVMKVFVGYGLFEVAVWARDGAIIMGILLACLFIFVLKVPPLALFEGVTILTAYIYRRAFPKYATARPASTTPTGSGTDPEKW